MNILMMTNTYLPHVGGVARSIEAFSSEYRQRGHQVLIVAPMFDGVPDNEENVIRIPAIQNFNGSDFSAALPVPGILSAAIKNFKPDVIHSHHPFLIGSTALRIAHTHEIPLVFTHHTKYEEYTHYMPGDSQALKRFVIRLSTNYANLCDQVFVPSESIAALIRERGVKTPVDVVPTGVKLSRFDHANGLQFRKLMNIAENAFVIGHLGRLAKEKNLTFLTNAAISYLKNNLDKDNICFMLVGEGPMKETIKEMFANNQLSEQLSIIGILDSSQVADAYNAMDVFAFASKSETQGMVITEAMAAGTPVVALDAPGVREVVRDYYNGRLLHSENLHEFAAGLEWIQSRNTTQRKELIKHVKATAEVFSMQHSADKALQHFTKLCKLSLSHRDKEYYSWASALHYIEAEWERLNELTDAVGAAINPKHVKK